MKFLIETVKKILPESLYNYLKGTGMYFFGLYFDIFIKKYKIGNLVFEIPYDLTDRKFRSLFTIDKYEKSEQMLIRTFLQPDAAVLELGACLGIISCVTNSILKNPQKHVVLEANPALIPWLTKNRNNNAQFSIENCIISRKKKNPFFFHGKILDSSADRHSENSINVEGKTVRDIEKKYRINFDTLIMDIEGGELNFLRENGSFLKQLKLVILELHAFEGFLTHAEVLECEEILVKNKFEKIMTDDICHAWKKKIKNSI